MEILLVGWLPGHSIIITILQALISLPCSERKTYANISRADPTYIQDLLNLVNTVPADGLVPSGARPSAGAVMTTKFCMSFSEILQL